MNPVLPLLYVEAFWQEYHAPVEIVMLLVGSGLFMKWAVDNFRYSRASAITWLLAVTSLSRTYMGCDVCDLPCSTSQN